MNIEYGLRDKADGQTGRRGACFVLHTFVPLHTLTFLHTRSRFCTQMVPSLAAPTFSQVQSPFCQPRNGRAVHGPRHRHPPRARRRTGREISTIYRSQTSQRCVAICVQTAYFHSVHGLDEHRWRRCRRSSRVRLYSLFFLRLTSVLSFWILLRSDMRWWKDVSRYAIVTGCSTHLQSLSAPAARIAARLCIDRLWA
ncbi:hypothetical protein DFH07DRAFT_117875 [Mycena maculata]|uniref:Uncharacterized protein n=1 Tax=Mycena maculata TaxID=230809 RepID=A0AAD7I493_9AGAR|nr:hypothetical protein DFH07DRAFT_117875 [Mycena maculata]